MKLFILFATLFAAFSLTAGSSNSEKKVVCYFGAWAIYRNGKETFDIPNIDANLCTHLIYSFIGISNGHLHVLDDWADFGRGGYRKFNDLKKVNPKLKTLIAMGGWNEKVTDEFSVATRDPEKRTILISEIVAYVRKNGFDGFDVDWEYPNHADKKNFVLFLRELKEQLSQHGLLLTLAVGVTEARARESYIIREIAQTVDFINMMTYDFHGSWENTIGIVAPLYSSPFEHNPSLNVNTSIHYWLKQGAPAEKLILGVPFYGRTFLLANPAHTKPGSSSLGKGRGDGVLNYYQFCNIFNEEHWERRYEEYQRVPYAFKGKNWIGYDDVQSLIEKVNYAKQMKLGGMMTWSVDGDDYIGHCGKKYPLLRTLNRIHIQGHEVSTTEHPRTTLPTSTHTTEGVTTVTKTTTPKTTIKPTTAIPQSTTKMTTPNKPFTTPKTTTSAKPHTTTRITTPIIPDVTTKTTVHTTVTTNTPTTTIRIPTAAAPTATPNITAPTEPDTTTKITIPTTTKTTVTTTTTVFPQTTATIILTTNPKTTLKPTTVTHPPTSTIKTTTQRPEFTTNKATTNEITTETTDFTVPEFSTTDENDNNTDFTTKDTDPTIPEHATKTTTPVISEDTTVTATTVTSEFTTQTTVPSSPSTEKTTDKPVICSEPEEIDEDKICVEEGITNHPTDCRIFFHCQMSPIGWIAWKKNCPPKTLFDPEFRVCNHDYIVKEKYPHCNCYSDDSSSVY